MVSQFSASFSAQLDTYDVNRKICSLAQHNNIDEYIREFYQYKNLSPKGAMSVPILISYFIKGLKPDTIRAVILQTSTLLYKAAELACRCEHCLLDPISLNLIIEASCESSSFTINADGDIVIAIHTS